MSGHKVVGVLEAYKEAYVYGGTVYRRKQSVLTGKKRPTFTVLPTATAANTTASSSTGGGLSSSSSSTLTPAALASQQAPININDVGFHTIIDLVLSHRGAFKLRSRVTPPKTSQKGGGGGKGKKGATSRFSRRGADAKKGHDEGEGEGGGEEDEDDAMDPLDADAMMAAAANGDDIQKLYAQITAKREAKRRAKEGGDGASSAAAALSKPEVVWRQEHCFIRLVTPLLSVEAEEEEAQYLRQEEEEEERRQREEDAEAKASLAMGANNNDNGENDGNLFGPSSSNKGNKEAGREKARRHADPNNNNNNNNNKLMAPPPPYMALRKGGASKSVSELAVDKEVPDDQLYGFTVHYFAIGKGPKAASEETSVGAKYSAAVRNALSATNNNTNSNNSSNNSPPICSVPVVRQRTYVCSSLYEQHEWLMVYRNTLLNYWHERLEDAVIPAPEIFQFEIFAMALGGGGGGGGGGSSTSSPYAAGTVVHCVLSTSALYIVPRGSKAEFERDDTSSQRFARMPVDALRGVVVSKSGKGTLAISGGPFGSSSSKMPPLCLAFFTHHECTTFVIELQRVWEMVSPAAAGADSAFPYQFSDDV